MSTTKEEMVSEKGKRSNKPRPYEKLRRAYEENRGTNLTAEDVNRLMRDTAIYDAVMEAYADEPEF